MDLKFMIANSEVAERAQAFARNMNGVESAELDGEELTVKLSPNGSENVVKAAVGGYIEAMGGSHGGTNTANAHSRLKFICRIVITLILTAAGAVAAHFGAETASLFLYIAAYIIIVWDTFLSVAESIKEKRRPKIAETLVCIITLAMFIIGWYLPAVVISVGVKLMRNA